jgi:hypothetical protein
MKNSTILLITAAVFLSVFTLNCSKSAVVDIAEAPTFSNIQTQILDKNCATSGCHQSEADASFLQHNLLLTSGKSYKNLLNVNPKNISAANDGLKRLIPFNSKKSLLFQKLLFDGKDHNWKSYGSLMPLGNDMLYKGQIEYIRQWIEAGAPETGIVADVSLLNDKTQSLLEFEPLKAPDVNDGFQVSLSPFEIYGNFEREIFVRKPLGNMSQVYINKFQLKMRPGSHHFIMYGFRNLNNLPNLNQVRDLRNKDNSLNFETFSQIGNHIFYFGGSESNITFDFPEGTAVEIPANATFDLNSHYFNRSSKPYNGEVYMNLYTVPKEKVKKVLKVLDFGNTSLIIPANKKTVITKDFKFSKNTKVVTLFSHTHKFGEKFEILIKGGARDGEVIYTNFDWEHPLKVDFATPISLKAGEGLTSRITYNNYSDKQVGFGFTSDDEMGIIFGYYYEE